ncbi:MAG: NAD-dependent epimerase/dehydratase family protein, partial [Gaiellaceae bacterium]
MRVLFLGGTSFTGPHAVRELAYRGHDVIVFHRGEHEPELPEQVRHVHGDLGRWDEHVDELRDLRPDLVVDMRAYVPEEAQRVLAFKGIARRAVVISSADVFLAYGRLRRSEPGPPEPLPLTEDSPLREAVVDEGYDKVGVERAVTADPQFPVTVLRYPAVHGPGDGQHRLYGYVRRMDDNREMILLEESYARWRWVRGYAEDVAHGLALAVESDAAAGRVYNVGDSLAYDELEWVRRIGEVVGWEGRILPAPREILPESLREDGIEFAQDYVVDSSRIREELGYAEVVEERTALERTIAWE